MNRSLRRTLYSLIIIGVIITLVQMLTREKPVAVILAEVKTGHVESTVTNTRAGTLKACRRARMSPPSGGQINKLPVSEGDEVNHKQILLELWNDDLTAQVKLSQNEAAAAMATAKQVCLVADNAEREAKRILSLSKKKLASEENADRATTNALANHAACTAAKSKTDVSAARIDVAMAQLERTRLRAPFTGTIAEINGELGEFVTPSPTGVQTLPAVDLVDNSCLYVSAPIDEVDAPDVKPGMDARISLDAFPNQAFPGIVQRIAPYVLEVEKQARTVDVETVFINPDDFDRMLPGYSADSEIILVVRNNVLKIPTEALLEGNRVLVFSDSDGMLVERAIKTGLSNWQHTEVISGVKAGERVVTSIDRKGVKDGVRAAPEFNTESSTLQ